MDDNGDAATLMFTLSVMTDPMPALGDTSVNALAYTRRQEIASLTLPQASQRGNFSLLASPVSPLASHLSPFTFLGDAHARPKRQNISCKPVFPNIRNFMLASLCSHLRVYLRRRENVACR